MPNPLAVMTGATSGIGEIAAKSLAANGVDLILLCRTPQKGEALRQTIQAATPDARITVMECHMDRLSTVADCGRRIAAEHPNIDLLINNAGTAEMAFSLTEDGIEKTFAVNHMSHFVLTHHLLPALQRAGAKDGARIVHTSSEAHYIGSEKCLDDVNFEQRRYFVLKSYADSKLANVLFSNALARQCVGTGVVSNCFHPGGVATNIWPERHWYERWLFGFLKKTILITPEQGAKPLLHLALDEEMGDTNGVFYFKMKQRRAKNLALDHRTQDRLWSLSEDLAGPFLK